MFGFGDLTKEERVALVGLLKVVVQADRVYTKAEDDRIDEIAREMGSAVFDAAAAEAEQKFQTLDELRQNATTVVRPEARALILRTLRAVAEADGAAPEEVKEIEALSRRWEA